MDDTDAGAPERRARWPLLCSLAAWGALVQALGVLAATVLGLLSSAPLRDSWLEILARSLADDGLVVLVGAVLMGLALVLPGDRPLAPHRHLGLSALMAVLVVAACTWNVVDALGGAGRVNSLGEGALARLGDASRQLGRLAPAVAAVVLAAVLRPTVAPGPDS